MLALLSIWDLVIAGGLLLILITSIAILVKQTRKPEVPVGAPFVKYPPQEDAVLERICKVYGEDTYAGYKLPQEGLTDKEKLQQRLQSMKNGNDYPDENDVNANTEADAEGEAAAKAFFERIKNDAQ